LEARVKLRYPLNPTNGAEFKIMICDNSGGMSEQTLHKLFELFFTIKETGLGLSLSKTIIDKHNGMINVESEINNGFEFEIIFPK
jgi:two-component system NtrC family sensor kinase